MELWDRAALGGGGRLLAQTSIALDLHDFEPFKAQSTSVELRDKENKVCNSPCQGICGLLSYLMQSQLTVWQTHWGVWTVEESLAGSSCKTSVGQ